jgi:hypothetical protein
MQHLSSSGCELVTCFVEEHVMVSRATGWKDGHLRWSVTHDAQKGLMHLDVQGEPPPGFAAIRDRKLAEQAADDGSVDWLFEIPVETARSVVGYLHNEDVPGLSGDVFKVLARPKNPSFFNRFFGGWSFTASAKDRIVLYAIWIAWGCSAIPTVWSDAIPYGRALTVSAWLGGFLFAVWFTARRFRKRSVNSPAPNPDAPSEVN